MNDLYPVFSSQSSPHPPTCSKTKLDLLHLEGTHNNGHNGHNGNNDDDEGGQTLEQQRDEVSRLMLDRDQLTHDKEQVSRRLHVALKEKDGEPLSMLLCE